MFVSFQFIFVFLLTGTSIFGYENKRTYKLIPRYLRKQELILKALEEDRILQKYFLYQFRPFGELKVEYHPKGSLDVFPVDCGNYISPLDSLDDPSFLFESFFPFFHSFTQELYTIILTDLDSETEKCHAIWTNLEIDKKSIDNGNEVHGEEDVKGFEKEKAEVDDVFFEFSNQNVEKYGKPFKFKFDLNNGKRPVQYVGPRPAKDTGVHRYVFILFRQPLGELPFEGLKFRERWGSDDPGNGVEMWADYYNLQPLAINYFRSANEGDF